jgi:hypothetical protein
MHLEFEPEHLTPPDNRNCDREIQRVYSKTAHLRSRLFAGGA